MEKKKHADTIESMELCEGVYLQEEFFEKKENRVLTLLLKGFIVYLLSMGSIGFYLTAFDISFHVGLCHVLILLTSLGCAMLYYRLMVETSVICFCLSPLHFWYLHSVITSTVDFMRS